MTGAGNDPVGHTVMGHKIDKECIDFMSFVGDSYPPNFGQVVQEIVEAAITGGVTLAVKTYHDEGEEGLISLMDEVNAIWGRLSVDADDRDACRIDPDV